MSNRITKCAKKNNQMCFLPLPPPPAPPSSPNFISGWSFINKLWLPEELAAESRNVSPLDLSAEATVGGDEDNFRGRSLAEVMVTIRVIVNNNNTIIMAV
jgi:hypothetical protein